MKNVIGSPFREDEEEILASHQEEYATSDAVQLFKSQYRVSRSLFEALRGTYHDEDGPRHGTDALNVLVNLEFERSNGYILPAGRGVDSCHTCVIDVKLT